MPEMLHWNSFDLPAKVLTSQVSVAGELYRGGDPMSRDGACDPHFSFAKFQISIFSSPVLGSDSLDRSELLLFAAACAWRTNRVSGDCKNFVCVLSSG